MKPIISVLCVFVLTLTCFSQTASDDALRLKHFNTDNNKLAVSGYDVVNYFLGAAKKGKKDFSYTYKGIVYMFSSQKNLDLFKSAPAKFEPMFGGWCAYAMGASGEKVEVDPETFKIVNGKLYLFYNAYFNNTLVKWNKDETNLNAKAIANWSLKYK